MSHLLIHTYGRKAIFENSLFGQGKNNLNFSCIDNNCYSSKPLTPFYILLITFAIYCLFISVYQSYSTLICEMRQHPSFFQ